jgi:transcriptional regulator with XRE-family HTH domain
MNSKPNGAGRGIKGKDIFRLRQRLKMTQVELANALRISQARVSEYERGKRGMPGYIEKTFRDFAEIANFNADSEFGGKMEDFDIAEKAIEKAKNRREINEAVGDLLLKGYEKRRWKSYREIPILIRIYLKIFKKAGKRLKEIESSGAE